MCGLDPVQHLLHAIIKPFHPKNTVEATPIHHQRRQVICNRRPVNIGRHRTMPLHGIPGKQQNTIGQNRELLVVICQGRQVAQRLVSQINRLTDINALAYLFNDPTVILPDLGGIQDSLSKRNRHRKALLRLVFDSTHANRLMICIDPEDIDLIKDFCVESPSTRLLQIDCELTDRYLTDHAIALDLIAAKSPQGAVRRLLPRLRAKILQDRAHLELAGFDNHYRIADQADINDTADTLSRFLALPAHTLRADELAEDLFSNEDAHVL